MLTGGGFNESENKNKVTRRERDNNKNAIIVSTTTRISTGNRDSVYRCHKHKLIRNRTE